MRISDGSSDVCSSDLGELASEGFNVALLDADPQGSASDWAERRAQNGHKRLYGVFGLARESLHVDVPHLACSAAFVAIRSSERRVGKAFVRTYSTRWSPSH